MTLTVHSIVKNEDRFVYFALKAWLPYCQQVFLYDDNSTDNTKKIVEVLAQEKLVYQKVILKNGNDLTSARNAMLAKTTSDWFLLLDGDEVWNDSVIIKFLPFLAAQPKNVFAVGMRTRNAIGDVYHYLPEESGKYAFLGKKGHLNTRAYRKVPGFSWQGTYPTEFYTDLVGHSINDQSTHLAFFDDYYWHYTNLLRSSVTRRSFGRKPVAPELGIKASDSELPEVFFQDRPSFVPDPLVRRSLNYSLKAGLLNPVKKVKRYLKND